MRRARSPRKVVLGVVLLLTAGVTGCTHYHIYQQPVPVAVNGVPAAVPYGAMCDVPASAENPDAPAVAAAPPRSRVLVSQPQAGPGPRFAWRRPDPEGIATTRVEGGIDESRIR